MRKDCDVSSLKQQIVDILQHINLEINQFIISLERESYCLLGNLEQLKGQIEQTQTAAASFYLNCYLSPYTEKYLEISTCIQHLSSQKHGALIAIEREQPLETMISAGNSIGATLTFPLLESIFYPGNPLHDGAVLIRGDLIISAANVLPLSKIHSSSKKLGTRHRAAIGLTEISDALVLVVSEETGRVSFAVDGKLYPINMSSSIV
ncbi:sporulation-specific diadenylate cyclase CdaS [Fictibacillus terranigra]|uniref:Diadenylate cyclase n=1 Tax=Fictibacillus terranigra TaxID=3058424 RepID=A0ABT8E5A7_9BACL|nr:sporulation-specific diadenylate cyclase CdaS [Fictibacillus sp. CENA-BCM004]MDN4073097.1 sporulation-specific diadenylate cyclase CdaS [Fictibacillus sp. CENA-BCM004]